MPSQESDKENNLQVEIRDCTEADFDLIRKYIAEYELDDRQLQKKEFVVAHANNNLLGFGRVREYEGFSEMCSLGILANQRHKGIGKLVFDAMLKKAKLPSYLVCIIPHYFEPFGYRICENYPPQMKEKMDYCTDSLVVPENYVVMRKQG